MSCSHHQSLRTAFFASILLTIVSACHTTYVQSSAPPHPIEHAPVVVHKYTYVHYPSCNVYCDRERKLWFWFEAGEWKMGVALPAHYRVVESEAVTIQLERDTPYEHAPVAPPPPQVAVEHGPPPHAQAHGYRRKFTYVHYPTFNVYCDRERKLWFWYENGAWRSGAVLPPRFHVEEREAVRVELEADTPFEHGNAHMAHDNGKGHGKNDDAFHAKHVDLAPPNEHDKASHGFSNDDKGKSSGDDDHKYSSDDKGKGSSHDNDKGANTDNHKGASDDKGKGATNDGPKDQGKDKGNTPSKSSGSNGAQGKGSGVTPSNDSKNGDASDDDSDGKSGSSNGNADSGKGKGKDKDNGKSKDKGKGKDKPDNG
jgi:hypothetical protein